MENKYENIVVFIEQRDGEIQKVSLEIIGKARELAEKLNCKVIGALIGYNIKAKAQDVIAYGADEVAVVDNKLLEHYATEPYTKAVVKVIETLKPDIALYGATAIGRDLAPRVSGRIPTGLTADCTKLEIEEGTNALLMTRPAFGGNLMATIISTGPRPQMATVRAGVMKAMKRDDSRKGEIIEIDAGLTDADMNVKILEVVKGENKSVDISEAKILVSGGRGIGKKENLSMLRELADELGGEVSVSRALADAGYAEKALQVGQTGKTVHPNLYVACGISGAIQHLAGMEDSDFIIAINKDNTAPIFDVADLGIVGDLTKIVPKLTEAIKKYKAENAVK